MWSFGKYVYEFRGKSGKYQIYRPCSVIIRYFNIRFVLECHFDYAHSSQLRGNRFINLCPNRLVLTYGKKWLQRGNEWMIKINNCTTVTIIFKCIPAVSTWRRIVISNERKFKINYHIPVVSSWCNRILFFFYLKVRGNC